LILGCLSGEEGRGIPSVEVKFVDIGKNTGGEGGDLVLLLTLRRESVGSKQD
jgi:tetrahydromethanopterin S-methyltransferase subunit D